MALLMLYPQQSPSVAFDWKDRDIVCTDVLRRPVFIEKGTGLQDLFN